MSEGEIECCPLPFFPFGNAERHLSSGFLRQEVTPDVIDNCSVW